MTYRLRRKVNKRIRYYSINIQKNLFSEWILSRTYGSIEYKNPTRSIKSYFSSKEEALRFCDRVLNQKIKRGYILNT